MTTVVNSDSSITFHLYAPQAHSVSVLGNFNMWESWDLEHWGHGNWGLHTSPQGHRDVIYKFLVDGRYINDPSILNRDQSHDGNTLLNTGADRGTLIHSSFYSQALQEEKKYAVYLPPGYYLNNRDYPVLFLMGGLMDYEMSWPERGGIAQIADHGIHSGEIEPMIIVMPDKSQAWTTEGEEHRFFHYISEEVVSMAQERYRVSRAVGSRAIEGLSIGAHWAFQVASRNPYQYSSVSLLSCPVSEDLFQLSSEHSLHLKQSGIRVRLNCGNQEEQMIPACTRFQQHLNQMGVHCEFYVGDGPHDWPLWAKEIGNSLKFHSSSFRA